MRDAYAHITARPTLAVTARTATANGTSVDRAGGGALYQDAAIVVHTGTITDGTHAIDVQESDDNSTWNSVPADQLQGSKPSIVAADDDKLFVIGYKGIKRYLRAVATVSSATTGGTYGAVVLLGNPRVAPVVHA
ncbi:hypothetical protein [Streptomyces viridosporus]|uniref:hypothetical protein n=1 Tax=Streptomyces viridosporus TaxID=67581 RepID=UPI003700E4C6